MNTLNYCLVKIIVPFSEGSRPKEYLQTMAKNSRSLYSYLILDPSTAQQWRIYRKVDPNPADYYSQ
jgi:hypothetical protein